METTTLSTKYQLVLPKAIREALNLKPGQRFLVSASDHSIELVPCEPLSDLRGFLSGADTEMDDIRTQDDDFAELPGVRYFAKVKPNRNV